jgi:hypothetical protein
MSKSTSLKPFFLEEKQTGPNSVVTETTAAKWQQVCLANIKKEDKWKILTNITWDISS